MTKPSVRKAFTLIELLVVVAIIALLISILLPSLSQAREQGKKAVCLSNLKSIAQASHAYAVEDDREQIIPLGMVHVRDWPAKQFPGEWGWRTAEVYAFGGRTAIKPFPIGGSPVTVMMDYDNGGKAAWQAFKRPLNAYVYGDVDLADMKKLEMYHCPSDTGYPNDTKWIQDCPFSAFEIPLYDMVGNSYRINVAGLAWLAGGSFSVGSWGHQSSTIENPSRVVLYSEPLFYNMSRQGINDDPTRVPLAGWHRKVMSDNVSFCDGSARLVRVDKLAQFDSATLQGMNYTTSFEWNWFLRRGKTWQTDCYPSPGGKINKYDKSGQQVTPSSVGYRGWPFDNYQENNTPS